MKTSIKIDPYSGEEFVPKKVSQIYACSANRIKHNNQIASKLRQDRAFLDKHVHKNHKILREIWKEGSDNIFNSYWLEGKGFRFDATNHQVEFQGILRPCVYEFMLIVEKEANEIKIIKS